MHWVTASIGAFAVVIGNTLAVVGGMSLLSPKIKNVDTTMALQITGLGVCLATVGTLIFVTSLLYFFRSEK